MNKRIIPIILAVLLAVLMIAPAGTAEQVSVDPFEEITNEFAGAKTVEPYEIAVHPPRVTGWAYLRWAPSNSAPIIATYPAKQTLTVRRELPNWLLAENTATGDIGYISRSNVAEPGEAQKIKELNPTIEENGKTNLGVIDINGAFSLQCKVAEGYLIMPLKSASDQMVASVVSEDPTKPRLTISVAYDEAYADVDRMNDLSDADFAVLESTFTDSDPTAEITYGDTGLGTRLMIVHENENDSSFLDILSIYKGYFVECVMVPSEMAPEKTLTETELEMCIEFLTEMDFVPAGEEATDGAASLEGKWVTNLTDYNPDNNTVTATVMYSPVIEAAAVEALQPGDELAAGELLKEKVDKIEKVGDGEYEVNEIIFLKNYGGEYHIYIFDYEYMEIYKTLTLTVPDDLIITDEVDPATGEILDEPAEYTVDEFRAMLEAETYPNFATDNVWVTFDGNGKMLRVDRFYTPWQ